MSTRSIGLSDALQEYVVAHSMPADDVLAALSKETRDLGEVADMQISPEQGAFLTIVTRLLGARSAVEVGTFTGYSAICIARGLAPGGRLLCCDVSEEWTAIARRAWAAAGVEDRIELRLAPALETLRGLPAGPTIDLAFIDADKPGYAGYWDELVPRMRPGGVLLVDNVLWSGGVVDESVDDEDTRAIRAFNARVRADDRVDAVILPLADGVTLALRRADGGHSGDR
jgi:caffeoyl-CoA O-methyltransferase